MAYEVNSALYQWQDGARRVQGEPGADRGVDAVVDALRRRLGSRFTLAELADLYGEGVDWAWEIAARRGEPGGDASAAVNAGFFRYAREATDYAGGRVRRGRAQQPDD